MATATVSYSSNTTITMDLGSLASSSNFTSGVESAEVDNTTNKYVDVLVQGKVTVGTTPTANTQIVVYVWGADTSLGTTVIDVLDGTTSAETLTNVGIFGAMRLGSVIQVPANTSNVTYNVSPFNLASLFGLVPKYWGLFVAHNTGVNLNATNSNLFSFNGIKYDIA